MSPSTSLVLLAVLGLVASDLPERCQQPKDVGFDCAEGEKRVRFYRDQITGVCQPLFYKGCGGNENRFESAKACREECQSSPPMQTRKGKVVRPQPLLFKDICNATYSPNLFEPLQSCKSDVNACGPHFSCFKGNCCPKKDYVCGLDYDSGKEAAESALVHEGRYAFNARLKTCGRFSYFRTEGNFNNFQRFGDCMAFCSSS
uniref:Kunitz/Bovine pancreatic trypsin inhibitor domain protein n=1 Tax=Steinernema glaseri TaxID=37863 RepID=A0A1I7ZD50_9BILA